MTSSESPDGRDGLPVVAFDLMDTLLRDPFREALEAATGVHVRELFRLRDPGAYPALERGEIDEDDYWRVYADAGLEVSPETFHRVRREGYRWLDGMRDLLEDLDGHARRVIASNYPCWIDEVAATWLDGLADEVHASCHLGARKPDPEFYLRLCEAVATSPEQVFFVDDRPANVDGARAVGMAAVLYEGAPTVRAALRSWGLLGDPV